MAGLFGIAVIGFIIYCIHSAGKHPHRGAQTNHVSFDKCLHDNTGSSPDRIDNMIRDNASDERPMPTDFGPGGDMINDPFYMGSIPLTSDEHHTDN